LVHVLVQLEYNFWVSVLILVLIVRVLVLVLVFAGEVLVLVLVFVTMALETPLLRVVCVYQFCVLLILIVVCLRGSVG